MTAGPTPLPPAVSQVMAEPMLYHRAPAFVEVYARVLERLKEVFQTENEVLLFAARAPGRWSRPSRTSSGPASRPGRLAAASSASAGPSCATPTALRRSTSRPSGARRSSRPSSTRARRERGRRGRLHHLLRDLDRRRQRRPGAHRGRARHGALIAVDAVSGLGAVPLPQDEWGVDVVVAGSQKALDVARPGSASPARTRRRSSAPRPRPGRRYYFDWSRTLTGQRKDPPDSPFTPAVGALPRRSTSRSA